MEKKLEQAIIHAVLRLLGKAGWQPYQVQPDGEAGEPVSTIGETLDLVNAYDYTYVHFRRGEEESWIHVMNGEGDGVIQDFGTNLSYLLTRFHRELEKRIDITIDLDMEVKPEPEFLVCT